MNNSKEMLKNIVIAADDKLAQETLALDVQHITPLADYFVITQGRNEKQVHAIVDSILETMHKLGYEVKNVEGRDFDKWVVIDLNEVIVHVFYEPERVHYNLEKIWLDAPLVDLSQWIDA